MVRALGYSIGEFDPVDPGRLCRGRERWIDSYELEPRLRLQRIVVSGASFADDSARDAMRGLSLSGASLSQVLSALFPRSTRYAFAEDAHPSHQPPGAQGLETYTLRRPGGPLQHWRSRWLLTTTDDAALEAAVAHGADLILITDGLLPAGEGYVSAAALPPEADAVEDPRLRSPIAEAFRQKVHFLMGPRMEGPPARHFQPVGLLALLEQVRAVVLLHLDKHTPCLGIYTREELPAEEALRGVARAAGCLAVPFAIPPMLARWDRALWELRQDWDPARQGEFPVPPAVEHWRGWRRGPPPRGEEE
jgi:hypothetical protein